MIYCDLCSLVLMAVTGSALVAQDLLTYSNVVVCHQIKLYNVLLVVLQMDENKIENIFIYYSLRA